MIQQPFFPSSESGIFAIPSLQIFGEENKVLRVPDPSQITGYREGRFFVRLPQEIVLALPGSKSSPQAFLQWLEIKQNPDIVLSGRKGEKNDILHIDKTSFALTVSYGSSNDYALRITQLAAKGFSVADIRAEYQRAMYEVIKASLVETSVYDLRVIDDCIATGDTIIGVVSYLVAKRKMTIKRVRVDVVCATTQGLSLLYRFASDNDFSLDIHVGYLAYGLSEGKKFLDTNTYTHANYITYPEGIVEAFSSNVGKVLESCRANDGSIYVVGDMGDGGKSMPNTFDERYPWNTFRKDIHGEHRYNEKYAVLPRNERLPMHVYCANGGYLMQAFYRLANGSSYVNDLLLSAKRVWSTDQTYMYGVIIDTG